MWLSYQMIHDFLKIPRNLANAQLLNGIFYESTKNYSHANFPTTVKSAKATRFKIQTNRDHGVIMDTCWSTLTDRSEASILAPANQASQQQKKHPINYRLIIQEESDKAEGKAPLMVSLLIAYCLRFVVSGSFPTCCLQSWHGLSFRFRSPFPRPSFCCVARAICLLL